MPPLAQPVLIAPAKFARVPNDGRVLGRGLEEEPIRIRLQTDVAMQISDFEFVMGADADARHENFPYAGRTQGAHRMAAPIPLVEIADDANPLRIRRPNRETSPGHPIDRAQLRAELIINAPFVALAKEIQIRFAQG